MDTVNACEHGRELWETSDSEDDSTDASDGISESLSDIDDAEVGSYLHDEKEKQYKKKIWELMNKKYLEEQEAKKVAAASNVTNSKKELRPKKTAGVKITPSTEAHPILPKKRPSSRINYNALSEVLDDHLSSDEPKKKQSCLEPDNVVDESSIGTPVDDATNETEDKEDDWEDDEDYSHYNNQEEEYDFYDDEEYF